MRPPALPAPLRFSGSTRLMATCCSPVPDPRGPPGYRASVSTGPKAIALCARRLSPTSRSRRPAACPSTWVLLPQAITEVSTVPGVATPCEQSGQRRPRRRRGSHSASVSGTRRGALGRAIRAGSNRSRTDALPAEKVPTLTVPPLRCGRTASASRAGPLLLRFGVAEARDAVRSQRETAAPEHLSGLLRHRSCVAAGGNRGWGLPLRWMGNSGNAGRRRCVGRSPPEEPGEIRAGVLIIERRGMCAGMTACCSERSL
jgi:hypothetical protein